MLNEPASSFDDDYPRSSRTLPIDDEGPSSETHYSEIHRAVESVLAIEEKSFTFSDKEKIRARREDLIMLPRESQLLMTFKGRLLLDSEAAYDRLDEAFAPHDLLPIFRSDKGQHIVHVVHGRAKPGRGGVGLAIGLFIATVFSVLFVGTLMAINEIAYTNPARASQLFSNIFTELWRGLPYAGSILLILGAHEMGHYLMARRHGVAASLPYFLPFPFGLFGTFGAAIRLREPMRNRKVLMDIGAAGPLAGLIFAIPIVIIGLATSPVNPIEPGLVEGNSVLYALAKVVVFGRFLPDGNMDVFVNQVAWAGWTGLLVTGLNLIPVGQLDGGHVLYATIGRKARLAFYPLVGAMLLLTVLIARELFVFVLLILLLGNYHATPLDDITRLDKRRRNVAVFTLIVFFLVFVPSPLSEISDPATNTPTPGSLIMLPVILMTLLTNRSRWLGRYRLTKR